MESKTRLSWSPQKKQVLTFFMLKYAHVKHMYLHLHYSHRHHGYKLRIQTLDIVLSHQNINHQTC
jgi:hypothetical protein